MWHYIHDEEPVGPISRDILKALLRKGQLSVETLVWTEGFAEWKPAGEVEELREAFNVPPPPPARNASPRPRLPGVRHIPAPDPGQAVTVEELWSEAVKANPKKPEKSPDPLKQWFLKTFIRSTIEFKVFHLCALVAIIASARTYLHDATADPLTILLFGVACVVLGGLIFRFRTFSEGLGWSLLCITPRLALVAYGLNAGYHFTLVQGAALAVGIGVIDLIFLLLFWPKMWRAFVFHAGGWALIGAYLMVWPLPADIVLWR